MSETATEIETDAATVTETMRVNAIANATVNVNEALTLLVNGQPQATQARTLRDWVDAQGVLPEGLATAVNGAFVPRSSRASTALRAGDHILTFQPITGG